MAVERSFIVKLFADTSALEKAFGETGRIAGDAFSEANKRVNELVPGFQKIAVASGVAFAGMAAFATGAAKAAIEDEAEQAKLAKTLQNVVGATASAVGETEKFIQAQSRQTGFNDSELRPSIEALVRATGDLSEAQKQVVLAQNISAATGVPLVEVSNALARANVDNFKSLVALVPALRDNVKEGQSLDQVFGELQSTFSGAAQAAAGTTAGQLKLLSNSVSEAKESIGAGLLPALTVVIAPLTTFSRLIEDNSTLFSAALIGLLAFTGAIVIGGVALKAYAVAAGLAAVATKLFGVAISTTGVGVFVVAIGTLVTAVTALALWLRKTETSVKNLQSATADASGIVRVAGNSYIYLTTQTKLLNSALSTNVNLLDTQSRRLEGLARAYGITTFATGKWKDETGKAGGATKEAVNKLAEYTSVLKKAQSASDAFGSAQKRVGSAQTSVADANKALADAQEALDKAQRGGTAQDIAAAQRAVAAAERGVARAKFSHEEAIMKVRDAEKELADIRKDPEATADDIRRAEIGLAEAKFNVADSEDRQIETANRLTEARRNLRIATSGLIEGDAELIPLKKAVELAERQQKSASDELTEAIKAQKNALEDYTVALTELGKAAEMFPRIAARIGAPDLIPLVPTPTPAATGTTGSPQAVNATITVNSSVVNSAQVGQEIYEYLKDYVQVGGDIRLNSVL
jgi:hypothetical protein